MGARSSRSAGGRPITSRRVSIVSGETSCSSSSASSQVASMPHSSVVCACVTRRSSPGARKVASPPLDLPAAGGCIVVAVEPLTIGELAARLGVPVRTVRFWSDEGLVAPPARSGGGYRLYDAPAVARLDLVRTLRELGLGLPAIRELLAQRRSVREVAAEHVRALDGEIRLLRLRRTLLQHVATVGSTTEEMRIVHDLATLSARERQQMIDDFVARVFGDVPDDAPGAGIAQGMRTLPAELPDEPTPEQVSAWLELAGLVADASFEARVREMALAGAAATPEDPDALDADMGQMQT